MALIKEKESKSILSPLLFLILIDDIIKALKNKIKCFCLGNWLKKPLIISELIFVDDVALLAKTEEYLQHIVNCWTDEMEKRDMQVSLDKTKSMILSLQSKNTMLS
jgi:hypothetical protein